MDTAANDLLEPVLGKTAGLIANVAPDQSGLPTPCPEFEVGQLVDHLDGWAAGFAARVTGQEAATDPGEYRAGPDPAAEFSTAAAQIAGAYRDGTPGSEQLPVGLLLMEFVTHGWDLATATGQPVPYSAAEAQAALDAGQQMLKPEYRGPGKTFGAQVPVADDAGAVERLVGFLGRDPGWSGHRRTP